MPFSFPLSLNSFFSKLAIVEATFFLSAAVATSETAGGEILTCEHGPRLWGGTIQLHRRPHADYEEMVAMVEMLFDANASFLVSPSHAAKILPSGTLADQRDGREVKLGGLPGGSRIKPGDFLSFTYGSNPARYALHRALEEAIASDTTGTTGWLEVSPRIRTGAPLEAAIELMHPVCKAKAVPGSLVAARHSRVFSEGCSFSWRQTLR